MFSWNSSERGPRNEDLSPHCSGSETDSPGDTVTVNVRAPLDINEQLSCHVAPQVETDVAVTQDYISFCAAASSNPSSTSTSCTRRSICSSASRQRSSKFISTSEFVRDASPASGTVVGCAPPRLSPLTHRQRIRNKVDQHPQQQLRPGALTGHLFAGAFRELVPFLGHCHRIEARLCERIEQMAAEVRAERGRRGPARTPDCRRPA